VKNIKAAMWAYMNPNTTLKLQAWQLYCKETKDMVDSTAEFWDDLSPEVQKIYIAKVIAAWV
jgi:hypothetical protein